MNLSILVGIIVGIGLLAIGAGWLVANYEYVEPEFLTKCVESHTELRMITEFDPVLETAREMMMNNK